MRPVWVVIPTHERILKGASGCLSQALCVEGGSWGHCWPQGWVLMERMFND